MGRGSKPGERRGGRKAGTPNKSTTALMDKIKAGGETPLEVMLREMRDKENSPDVRRAMAIAAAPYCHSRLASTEQKLSGNIHCTHEEALGELE